MTDSSDTTAGNGDLALIALKHLLTELIDGASPHAGWVLNPNDPGLLDTLRGLSAEEASRAPVDGQKSIAAHASHVHYGIELLNRWADGEENPFATADWDSRWQQQTVSDEEWQDRLNALQLDAHRWIAATQEPREWDEIAFTGTLASAAHLAYHFGAIKQMLLMLRSV